MGIYEFIVKSLMILLFLLKISIVKWLMKNIGDKLFQTDYFKNKYCLGIFIPSLVSVRFPSLYVFRGIDLIQLVYEIC